MDKCKFFSFVNDFKLKKVNKLMNYHYLCRRKLSLIKQFIIKCDELTMRIILINTRKIVISQHGKKSITNSVCGRSR